MILLRRFIRLLCCVVCLFAAPLATSSETSQLTVTNWQEAAEAGNYDEAARLAESDHQTNPLARLIEAANAQQLAQDPQWLAFIHYKPTYTGELLSQVDSSHFFMSDKGKTSPTEELIATLASFFSSSVKPPLRLTAYCRFVARRIWIEEKLPDAFSEVPEQDCIEFKRYKDYLDADVLTLVFPTAHPNSPSSAFGHTLLRIDKKDQRHESRLLNMSLNFAADVPAGVPSAAYAYHGLTGGFEGRFRLLPYHIKLREYGQIENRDTWEYELKLDKPAVDLVLRHAYEMLISHYDYYFLSENCSYHLLSLIEVAFPDNPITDEFNLWTIPVDTIRKLEEFDLAQEPRFVPSAIRTLRARQNALSSADSQLAITANQSELSSIDEELNLRSPEQQAAILDLLSDYERYNRLETNTSAQGSSDREKAILSRRSKLGIKSVVPDIKPPIHTPDAGHGTSRIGLSYRISEQGSDILELNFRPAYHDFRDPSPGYDDKAAIELGKLSIGYDVDQEDLFLKQFTFASIESIEPVGSFFKPVSWHTNILWDQMNAADSGQFTFNVGVGKAKSFSIQGPVFFGFGEADVVYSSGFDDNTQLRLGASGGMHWEIVNGFRTGLESSFRHQLGGDNYSADVELWAGIALAEQWSLNVDYTLLKQNQQKRNNTLTIGIRSYF